MTGPFLLTGPMAGTRIRAEGRSMKAARTILPLAALLIALLARVLHEANAG